jgi:acetyl-CoA/propionyl-CoA carboxylase biotin carboxyl carrier protein
VRIDSGVETGTEIGTDYDPMLVKVVAHGHDREDALGQLEGALARTRVLGPVTNVAFMRALLARPEVREGAIDTGLIERLGSEVAPPANDPVLAAAALGLLIGPSPTDDPWDDREGWRQSGAAWLRGHLSGPDGNLDVAIRKAVDDQDWEWKTGTDSGLFSFDSREEEGEAGWLESEGISRRVESYLFEDERVVWLVDGAAEPARFEWVEASGGAGARAGGGSLEAPMPGVVIDVRSEPGAAVEEGDVLIVLESMKMELSVQAPRDGIVAEILIGKGEQVARGQTLIALTTEEEAD